MPRVSVVIATYKRPEALGRAIRTALDQTITDLEIVVAIEVDDADSVAVVEAATDARVRYVVNAVKGGPGPARDTGSAASSGDWIAFLDDDDIWHPTKLERQLALADRDSQAIVMTLTEVVTTTGRFVRPTRPYDGHQPIDEWLFDRLSWFGSGDSMLQTSSLLVPRLLTEVVPFGTARHEEWELAIRAVKLHGYRLLTVPEPLVTYRGSGTYPWRPSLDWALDNRSLLSRRALAGFCLTKAVHGIAPVDRNRAFAAFLKAAFRFGRPTSRQLFAFALIWASGDALRGKVRAILRPSGRS